MKTRGKEEVMTDVELSASMKVPTGANKKGGTKKGTKKGGRKPY
jgi:hypothetical protein